MFEEIKQREVFIRFNGELSMYLEPEEEHPVRRRVVKDLRVINHNAVGTDSTAENPVHTYDSTMSKSITCGTTVCCGSCHVTSVCLVQTQ